MSDLDARPVFILSFRQRDELAGMAARAGWRPIAARRADGLVARVSASGAPVVVIDARGALEDGLAATRAISDAADAAERAIVVLLSRGDADALDGTFAAGATHFLLSPMREIEFTRTLRFAERCAVRVAGGERLRESRWVAPLGWRYDHARRSLQITPELADLLGVAEQGTARAAIRRLDVALQSSLRAALRRLPADRSTAFAHDLPRVGRVVAHLQHEPRTGRIHGLIEPLGEIPSTDVAVRALFPRRSRSIAALADELPAALDRGEIDILFQPQVEIASGRITGVEALARWPHPRLGEIGAEALLAAAAHGGRATELSTYLQRRALTIAAAWPAALAHLHVAINVTAADIAEVDFARHLLDRIDASGIARSRITVEVTESGLIADLLVAARLLEGVRAAGCRVAIDDFGTGYSSLAYLNALPVDYLKLDKALTSGITGAARDRVVVRGVIDMARSLGLAVIAEGVETAEQRDLLAAEGCRLYQGYLCAPPLDSGALARLVGEGG